jgi:chemotaxis protein histidine kinase CheA
MLNGTERKNSLPDFLSEAQTLLTKSDECLSHLELFTNDKDAIECLLSALLSLANKADGLAIDGITDFSLRINRLLSLAYPHINLQGDALRALKNCFTLLAWQLELIDADTGMLLLDDDEQFELLSSFAAVVGLEDELAALVPNTTPSTSLKLDFNAMAHRH